MAGDRTLVARWKGVVDPSLKKATAQVTSASERAGKKSVAVWSAIGSAIGNFAATMATRAIDAVADLAGEAIRASDATDKFKNTLSFAGFKNTAIEKASRDVQAYADKTVYGLSDIQNTAAQLSANGVKNFVGLTKAAGNLNAVAGGNAETFKSVGMVMSQTNSAGKLTTENWNQLANAIPGAAGKVQEALKKNGAYTGDFRTAMAKGQITAKEFNQAISQLGNKPVAKKAAESVTTFEGAVGNLQATIVGKLMKGIDAIKPAALNVINGMAEFVDWIDKNQGAIKGWATGIGIVVGAFGALQIAQQVAAGGGLLKFIATTVKATKAWAVVQGALNLVMNANPIALVVIGIAALVAGIVIAYKQSETFRKVVDGAFDAIGRAGRWLWNNALRPAIQAIVKGFAWVVEGIAGFLDALGNIPGFGWAKKGAEGLRNLAAQSRTAADSIKKIPDPKVNTGNSREQIKQLDSRIKALKGKVVKARAEGDTKEVARLQKKINDLRGKKVDVEANLKKGKHDTIKVKNTGGGSFRMIAVAKGAVFAAVRGMARRYANGGMENHRAQIAPAGAWRVWAEPETGGESYIPLAASKRNRSRQIWWETGRRLGVVPMADGGVTGGDVAADADIVELLRRLLAVMVTRADMERLVAAMRTAPPGPRPAVRLA